MGLNHRLRAKFVRPSASNTRLQCCASTRAIRSLDLPGSRGQNRITIFDCCTFEVSTLFRSCLSPQTRDARVAFVRADPLDHRLLEAAQTVRPCRLPTPSLHRSLSIDPAQNRNRSRPAALTAYVLLQRSPARRPSSDAGRVSGGGRQQGGRGGSAGGGDDATAECGGGALLAGSGQDSTQCAGAAAACRTVGSLRTMAGQRSLRSQEAQYGERERDLRGRGGGGGARRWGRGVTAGRAHRAYSRSPAAAAAAHCEVAPLAAVGAAC